jgi:hypothetical protein
LEAFARWIAIAEQEPSRRSGGAVAAHSPAEGLSRRCRAEQGDVAEIVRSLDRRVRDRSRRDFAVVCDLLRLGLTGQQIWPLVAGTSKFESNGRPYFDVTIANAERTVLLDQSARHTEAST